MSVRQTPLQTYDEALARGDTETITALVRRLLDDGAEPVSILTVAGADCLHSVIDVADDVLHRILHAVEAALRTGDGRVLSETAWWVAELLRTRGADPELTGELGMILTHAMRDYPLAAALVATHFAVLVD
ncbi:MAG: hypothetical protein M3O32_03780 [Actinomycetota bacterium]|nr:hypothetical protein [Actinomycetota bacterium]